MEQGGKTEDRARWREKGRERDVSINDLESFFRCSSFVSIRNIRPLSPSLPLPSLRVHPAFFIPFILDVMFSI